jgi:hypothetical protein
MCILGPPAPGNIERRAICQYSELLMVVLKLLNTLLATVLYQKLIKTSLLTPDYTSSAHFVTVGANEMYLINM